jgi:hypothetical protein
MDIDKARTLLEQSVAAGQAALKELALAPIVVSNIIDTPDAFDRAMSLAIPGAILLVRPEFVYPAPLKIIKPVTIMTSGSLPVNQRMTADFPLAKFTGGVTIPSDVVRLAGVEVTNPNHLTDILTFSGKQVAIDACRVLGDPQAGAKRGIAANGGGNCSITRCWIDDCMQASPGSDSQAICAWDMAPGLLIEDNFMRGGSETLLFGGADAISLERMPTDIIVRGNTITARSSWMGLPIGVKVRVEFKAIRRAMFEKNIVEYSWKQGQDGYLLAGTVRNQDGKAVWSTVEDVVVQDSTFTHGAAAINLLGVDNNHPSGRMARVKILRCKFTDLDPIKYGNGSARLILIGEGPSDVTIDSNIFEGTHMSSQIYFYGSTPCDNLVVTNNSWPASTYGIFGDGPWGVGINLATGRPKAWDGHVTNGTLSGNKTV